MQVLLSEWGIQAVRMASRSKISGGRSLSKHLQDGIAWDEMNQQKDNRDHQPQDGQSVQESREQQLKRIFHGARPESYGSSP
jgi:Spy/CpxP family protein refolding chaperone